MKDKQNDTNLVSQESPSQQGLVNIMLESWRRQLPELPGTGVQLLSSAFEVNRLLLFASFGKRIRSTDTLERTKMTAKERIW